MGWTYDLDKKFVQNVGNKNLGVLICIITKHILVCWIYLVHNQIQYHILCK
jgi:hypothetical protein